MVALRLLNGEWHENLKKKAQNFDNSIVSAMELLQSCTKPSIRTIMSLLRAIILLQIPQKFTLPFNRLGAWTKWLIICRWHFWMYFCEWIFWIQMKSHWNIFSWIKHWFRLWHGGIRQQAVTWISVDSVLWHHMTSLSPSELIALHVPCFYRASKIFFRPPYFFQNKIGLLLTLGIIMISTLILSWISYML